MVGVPDGIGDEAVWLAVVPAQAKSEAQLKAKLTKVLPEMIDESALPDHIEILDAIPCSGRHKKPDREALRRAFARKSADKAGAP